MRKVRYFGVGSGTSRLRGATRSRVIPNLGYGKESSLQPEAFPDPLDRALTAWGVAFRHSDDDYQVRILTLPYPRGVDDELGIIPASPISKGRMPESIPISFEEMRDEALEAFTGGVTPRFEACFDSLCCINALCLRTVV